MNKYLIALILLLLVSCKESTREEIAHSKIKDYLATKGVNDYESMMLGQLDSAFTSVINTDEYYKVYVQHGICEAIEFLSRNHPEMYSAEELQANADEKQVFKTVLDSLQEKFVPVFNGWKIHHIYQTTDEKKGKVVNNYLFCFDKNLDSVSFAIYTYKDLPLKTYNLDPEFYQKFIEREIAYRIK